MPPGVLKTALFIDVGYLLTGGGLLFCGSWRREEIGCDHAGLLEALRFAAAERSNGALVCRAYWYDGALDGRPTFEQMRIGRLPYVKLRLGRIAKGAQKGVDAMICLDLVRLARRGAIDRAYLVSGDEDLCEAVSETQSYGVQVELMTVPPPEGQGFNLSAFLASEVDVVHQLPQPFWAPFFHLLDGEEEVDEDELVAETRRVGEKFARRLAEERSDQELEALLAKFPTLPSALDIELLVWAERSLGSLRRRPDLKTELRGRFWFALKECVRLRHALTAISAAEETPSSAY